MLAKLLFQEVILRPEQNYDVFLETLVNRPAGKADSLNETAFETARREAAEEIGLPDIGQPFFPPFRVEHLCELPANLAKTELVVRPCVALLHSYDEKTDTNADPEVTLIPRLDAKEVAAVFTAPFHNFLLLRDENAGEDNQQLPGKPEDWYRGSWTSWHESNWRSKSRLEMLEIIHAAADKVGYSASILCSYHRKKRHEASNWPSSAECGC
jgi:8-oxo-dGTP pyrophosphatase MutT (NUDIX family)